jgi:hypothetical protein
VCAESDRAKCYYRSSKKPSTSKAKAEQNIFTPVGLWHLHAASRRQGVRRGICDTLRCLVNRGIEIEGSQGMHFKSVRRIFLAIAGRFVIGGRRILLRVPEVMMKVWSELWNALESIPFRATA